jgi:hypothetical protein
MENGRNIFFFSWSLFLLLAVTGFLLKPDFSSGFVRDSFRNIAGCMLPFYPFYYFSLKGELERKHLLRFMVLLLPVMIIAYYNDATSYMIDNESESGEVVINMSYAFIGLIPFIMLVKKNRIIPILLLLLVMYLEIQSSKRGAILISFAGFLLMLYYQVRTYEHDKPLRVYLLAAGMLLLVSYFIYHFSIKNEFMITRMQQMMQGDTSDRSYIYSTILENWIGSGSLGRMLFGHGLAGSVALAGGLAHNDWLELLSSFGFTGVLLYGFIFISAIRLIRNSGWETEKNLLFITILILWFLVTLISMWFTNMIYFTHSILLGYLAGSPLKFLK